MPTSNDNRFSGCGLYLLWFLLLIFFYTLIGAIWSFKTGLEQGYPFLLLLGRIVVLTALFASTFGLLGRKQWAVWGFFSSAAVMIPLSVGYSYYFALQAGGFRLTVGWIVSNTIITALVVMMVVTIVFFIIRPRQTQ